MNEPNSDIKLVVPEARHCNYIYLCVNNVVLDLRLCDGDVLQNDLQPHRHHARHPIDQAGTDVAGHPPLKAQHTVFTERGDTNVWGSSVWASVVRLSSIEVF